MRWAKLSSSAVEKESAPNIKGVDGMAQSVQVGDLQIYRIGPGVLSAVSCHLVVQEGQAALIDSGFIAHHRALQRCLRASALEPSAITAILQTHGHLDHVGRLFEIKQMTGASAYMHEEELARLAGRFAYRGWARVCGWLEAIGRPLIRYREAEVEHTFEPGVRLDLFGGIEVVHLPGHTEGHCGFWFREEKLLFAGDLIAMFGIGTHLSPKIFNSAPAQYPLAFERVLALNPDHVLLNHYWSMDSRQQAAALKRFAEDYLRRFGSAA